MKKITVTIIMALLMMFSVSCKEKKSLQEEFDYYIENEDFEGIKKLEGKYFKYEDSRIDNTSLSSYTIFKEKDYDTDKFYRTPGINVYINPKKHNFAIIYTDYMEYLIKKPKNYKGADSQINKIILLNCESGYRLIDYPACKYDENGEIVLAGSVMCLRKAKILEDGSCENITVWNRKLIPDYVIEIKSPEDFTVSKGEDSKYFYYYDENHY